MHGVYLGDDMRSEVRKTTIGEWVFSFAVATVVGGLLMLLVAHIWYNNTIHIYPIEFDGVFLSKMIFL